MRKFAVLLYPDFSLQEITCLTSALTIWFGEKIDFIASEKKEYVSEEGLCVLPTRTTAEARITDYDCVILPGTVNPLPALFDDGLIDFLRGGMQSDIVFAAVSSAPILQFRVFAKGGRIDTGLDALEWIRSGVANGAGEIVLNSIDTDGVKNGFDLEMLHAVCEVVDIPIIASGGAGCAEHFKMLFHSLPKVDAGLAASIFHFGEVSIPDLKHALAADGIHMRL